MFGDRDKAIALSIHSASIKCLLGRTHNSERKAERALQSIGFIREDRTGPSLMNVS